MEIAKRIEKGTYLPLLSVSEEALENGEDIEEETLQPKKAQEILTNPIRRDWHSLL